MSSKFPASEFGPTIGLGDNCVIQLPTGQMIAVYVKSIDFRADLNNTPEVTLNFVSREVREIYRFERPEE